VGNTAAARRIDEPAGGCERHSRTSKKSLSAGGVYRASQPTFLYTTKQQSTQQREKAAPVLMTKKKERRHKKEKKKKRSHKATAAQLGRKL
jgi:hypothetical protein